MPVVGVPLLYMPGTYMPATTSGPGNPPVPAVLHGGLAGRGMPCQKGPKEAKREVYGQKGRFHRAIP